MKRLTNGEIEHRKSILRKSCKFELEPSEDVTLEDVFENEFFSSRDRIHSPDFYIWTPLPERLKKLLCEMLRVTLGIVGSALLFSSLIGLFYMNSSGESRIFNVVMAAAIFSYYFIIFLVLPVYFFSTLIVIIRYRRDLKAYGRDKVYWDIYHNQQSELDAYVKKRLEQHL